MKNGFYTIMAAQFFSSLADNALLIAAIALLHDAAAQAVFCFLLCCAGGFCRRPRRCNAQKPRDADDEYNQIHRLFHIAGRHAPAKYGILTELLPPEKLVIANGWIEGTTVGSIILGTALGGWLILPRVVQSVLDLQLPLIHTRTQAALLFISGLYILAALLNLG